MQVYAWRGSGSGGTPVQKRPDQPWARNEIEGIPASRAAALAIFDRLVIEAEGHDAGRNFRVGVASDLSPAVGTLHDGLIELSRFETPDRVQLTWIRGLWEELHIVYRSAAASEARTVARELVERADQRRRAGREVVGEGRSAGIGELRNPPHFVFVLIAPPSAVRRPAGGGG